MQGSPGIRIVLVDDNRMIRDGLKALFHQKPDIEVVGESNETLEVLDQVRALRPDLVVMNIGLGVSASMELMRRVCQEALDAKIIALSAFCNKTLVAEAFRAGAHAYVAKRSRFDDLIEAIETVLTGATYLCVHAREVVVEEYAGPGRAPQETPLVSLTERDCDVLRFLAEDKTSKEIAQLMHLSSKTIDACRRQLMQKLQVHGTAGLVKHASAMGLTSIAP